MASENPIKRMLRGHQAAAKRRRLLRRSAGPDPEQAVAETLSAVSALAAQGTWPAARDAASERAIAVVRRRWVLIQRNARRAQER